jgi:hypothetical protein
MTRTLAVILCVWLVTSGCTAARGPRFAVAEQPAGRKNTTAPSTDQALMADFVRQLPVGSRVKLTRVNGDVVRGTLMKGDADPIIVQRRTRIPEPPSRIPVSEIAALEIESSHSNGRALAIGIATGVGATFGFLAILVAVIAD